MGTKQHAPAGVGVLACAAMLAIGCGARTGLEAPERDGGGMDGDLGADRPGVDCPAAPAPPRLIGPLSASMTTSRRPTLRWQLAPGTDGAQVQICRDRSCTRVEQTLEADGSSARPADELAPGVHFWRAYGRAGGEAGCQASRTWEFFTGHRSAPVDTNWGAVPDVNGDGYADLVILDEVEGDRSDPPVQAKVYLGGPSGLASSPAVLLRPGQPPWDPLDEATVVDLAPAGDLDGDGYCDIFITQAGTSAQPGRDYRPGPAQVFLGSPRGLAATQSFSVIVPVRDTPPAPSAFVRALGTGDLDGDGHLDFVVHPLDTFETYGYLGSSSGRPTDPAFRLLHPFDGSGWLVASTTELIVLGGGADGHLVLSAQRDPDMGMITLDFYSTQEALRSGSASQTIAMEAGGTWPLPYSVGDLNADGLPDLAVASGSLVQILLGTPSGTGSSPTASIRRRTNFSFGLDAAAKSAGDVNADGYGDLMLTVSQASVQVFLGTSTGIDLSRPIALSPPLGSSRPFQFSPAGSPGDINGDGYSDVVTLARYGNGTASGLNIASVYWGGPDGPRSTPDSTIPSAPVSAQLIAGL